MGAVGDDRAGGTGQVTHDEIEVIAEELEGVEQEGVSGGSSGPGRQSRSSSHKEAKEGDDHGGDSGAEEGG